MRDDDLEHLECQLLDNHSSLRPLLGIFLFMLQQHQRGLALYCIAALSLICAFFLYAFPDNLQHMKRNGEIFVLIE